MQRFELTERELRPGCTEVRVSGELDLAVAPELDELLERLTADARDVVIDLAPCEFIDSSGLAVILRAHHRLDKAGRRLVMFGPSAQVLRVLSTTGLTANGLVFETVADALDTGPADAQPG